MVNLRKLVNLTILGSIALVGFTNQAQAKPYNQDEMINAIVNLKCSNKKLALFIGRTEKEPLPTDGEEWMYEESDRNYTWVSLDRSICKDVPEERLHLSLNATKSEDLEIIDGLFDKVVIDLSVWKFLIGDDNQVFRLASLLTPGTESKLMFESGIGSVGIRSDIQEPSFKKFFYDLPGQYCLIQMRLQNQVWMQIISEEKGIEFKDMDAFVDYRDKLNQNNGGEYDLLQNKVNEILKENEEYQKYRNIRKDCNLKIESNILEDLKKCFDQVEVVEDAPYYKNNYQKTSRFFVATGRKEH